MFHRHANDVKEEYVSFLATKAPRFNRFLQLHSNGRTNEKVPSAKSSVELTATAYSVFSQTAQSSMRSLSVRSSSVSI